MSGLNEWPDSVEPADVSLLGYLLGLTNFMVQPRVPIVGECEASHSRGVGDTFNVGDPESVKFLNPGLPPCHLFFGVSGSCGEGSARATLGGTGNLADAECTNLDFVSRSDVACFPAKEPNNLGGYHVRYALDETLPPNSDIRTRVPSNAGGGGCSEHLVLELRLGASKVQSAASAIGEPR